MVRRSGGREEELTKPQTPGEMVDAGVQLGIAAMGL
jgi:hypothetical protein